MAFDSPGWVVYCVQQPLHFKFHNAVSEALKAPSQSKRINEKQRGVLANHLSAFAVRKLTEISTAVNNEGAADSDFLLHNKSYTCSW